MRKEGWLAGKGSSFGMAFLQLEPLSARLLMMMMMFAQQLFRGHKLVAHNLLSAPEAPIGDTGVRGPLIPGVAFCMQSCLQRHG